MKQKFILQSFSILLLLLIGSSIFSIATNQQQAEAASFNAGNIISDAVFTNHNSMSVSQIQSFLNSKVPSCDTQGNKPSEYGGGTRKQYAASKGVNAPFTCLKNYSQNGKSSAQIIYNAAKQYQINPQVLIVLLQKEQGLVTDDWPWPIQYRSATGYGCPDNNVCDSQYYGLTNQINWAAKMFRAILNNSPTWDKPYWTGNNYIQWHPNSSCGGSTVNIQNRATAALYNYTPYRPNQAALNAGYGTGNSCSSYGNRNFYLYMRDWFNGGQPTYTTIGAIRSKHNSLGGNQGFLGRPTSNEVVLSTSGVYQQFQNGRIYYKAGVGAWSNIGGIKNKYLELGADKSTLHYPTADEVSLPGYGAYQQFQDGRIYWKSGTGAISTLGAIGRKYVELGGGAFLGHPITNEIKLSTGGVYQQFQNGRIYYKAGVGAHPILGAIGNKYSALSGDRLLGYPTSNEVVLSTGGVYQQFQNGRIYYKAGVGAHPILGAIGRKYVELGGDNSSLGYPRSSELKDSQGNTYQNFENGRVYWKMGKGAWL